MSQILSRKRRSALVLLLRPLSAEERSIFAMNDLARRELTLKHEDGLAFRLRIPYRHMEALKHMIPDMRNNRPREDQLRAWHWFMRDSLSRPYRVKA